MFSKVADDHAFDRPKLGKVCKVANGSVRTGLHPVWVS